MMFDPVLTILAVSKARRAAVELPTEAILKTSLLAQSISPQANALTFLLADRLIQREIDKRVPAPSIRSGDDDEDEDDTAVKLAEAFEAVFGGKPTDDEVTGDKATTHSPPRGRRGPRSESG